MKPMEFSEAERYQPAPPAKGEVPLTRKQIALRAMFVIPLVLGIIAGDGYLKQKHRNMPVTASMGSAERAKIQRYNAEQARIRMELGLL
jgi:hypothetical protein